MDIYPETPIRTVKEIIEYISRNEEDGDKLYEFNSLKIEGRNLWSYWTYYLCGVRQYSFIRLFNIKCKDGCWYYENFDHEVDFEDLMTCPVFLLDKTLDSPFKNEDWRERLKNYNKNSIPKDWEDCKVLFRQIRANDTGETLRVKFSGLKDRFKDFYIPYADVISIFPFIGRYKRKVYELKKPAIVGYEIIPKPKFPRGHIEKKINE